MDGQKFNVEVGIALEGVALILSERLDKSVTEWMKVSFKKMFLNVKLHKER